MKRLSVLAIIFIFAFAVIPNTVLATDPVVEVTDPNGGEVVPVVHTITITWDASDVDGDLDSFDLHYNLSGGDWTVIETGVAGGPDGSFEYEWDVPDNASDEVLIKVTAYEDGGDTEDESDAVFEIANDPKVVVTYPNGGERLPIEHPVTITWTCFNPDGDQVFGDSEVRFSTDNGDTWQEPNGEGTVAGGTYELVWTDVPQMLPQTNVSSKLLVRTAMLNQTLMFPTLLLNLLHPQFTLPTRMVLKNS